jgi:hypothetical protein
VLLGDRGSGTRCLLVWMSGTSGLGATARLAWPQVGRAWVARGSFGALAFDRALADLAAVVLLACVSWAWVALTATVLEAWQGVRRARRRRSWHLPEGARRAVLAACGVALTTSITVPALAADGAPHRHLRGPALLSGLPLPDRAVAPSRASAPPTLPTLLVRPGDSLWSIAAHDLGPGASSTAIDARWRAIYAANRALVGPDSDLIEPGQRLRLPRKDLT